MKYLIFLFLLLIEISIQARDITAPETINANETVGNITLGNGSDLTISSGCTLTVTGSISLGESADILCMGSGIVELGGSASQTITLTSSGWYSKSVITYLKIGNYSVIISKGANRQISINTIDYNCISSAVDLTALSNTPTGVNVAPSVPGSITSNSPQCIGTGITFTKGSCTTGTCYWVSSATGVETTNSANTSISASTIGTYTVYVRTNNGACWGTATSATGTVIPPPTTATNGSTQTICSNVSATLSGNNPTVGTGVWTVSGPSTSSSQFANANLYNTTFTPNGGAGSYIVTWTISNAACSTSATATITVNAIPTPGSISGSSTICSGNTSGTLTLTGNSNTVTKWQSSTVSDFSSNVIDIVNTSTTYTSGALSSSIYYRAVTLNGTCIANSAIATITVNQSPTSATNGSTQTICSNVSATLLGNNPTVGTGTWSVTGPNTSSTQFANAMSYNTTFLPAGGAGSYVVTWTTSNATCVSSATATITATAIPSAAGTVSGSNPKCTGSTSGLLTLTGNSNSITKWQSSTVYNFSSNVINIANTSSTYTSGALSATTYFRAVTSNGTCNAYSDNATIMVSTSVPSPAGAISGTTIQCSALTGQIYSITDVNNASTYTWTVPTGWTITAGQGTNSITVTTGSAGQNGNITVTPSNICGSSAGANLAVIVVSTTPVTPGIILGTATLCHNVAGQVYSIGPVANTSSYLWSVPTGWVITGGTGTTSLTVTSGASNTNGSISVVASNACGLSSAQTYSVTVSAGSTVPTSITGNSSVCLGSAITLTATGGTAYTGCTYEWGTGSVGSNKISGATSSSYTVTPSVGNTSIVYWTRRLDASPCNVVPTDGVTKSVYVSVMPTFTVTATPNPAYTNSSFSIIGAPNGMAYVWSNPNGYSSTFQSPTVYSPTVTYNSGVYTVTVTNSYGCKSVGSTPYVTVSDVSVHTYNGSGNMNDVSSWTNSATVNFAAAAQTYIINSNCTLNSDWTVSGNGSKIIVSSNTFTIPSNMKLITTPPVVIDVKNGATLNIANAVIPNLGVLGLTSTVNFSGSNINQIIPANYYGNLTVGTHGSDTVTFQSGYTGIYGIFSHDNANKYITTGNTIVFNGIDQDIPVFPYNNLSTEYGGNKTVKGNLNIKNHLRIGAVTTLLCGANNIYLEGSGELVSLAGKFNPGTGTVYYTNTNNSVVKAMNYYNLNTENGPRTLEPDSVISIANVFTPGASPFTTTGSTVEFVASGTTSQTIPVLNPAYNNVKIFATTTNPLNLGGNVTIAGTLFMIKGKVTTISPSFKLTISNPSASAVSEGSSNSYIIGPMTRILNANSTPTNATYIFPVGDAYYLPFSFSNYTTTTTQNITVRALSANCAGTYNSSLKNISTSEYWSASSNSLTDDFLCKVSLGKNSIGSTLKAIGHCHASSIGVFSSVNGSLSSTGNSVTGSTSTNFSYFVLAENAATQNTYYSKTGATNLSDLSNWTKNADGSGNTPINDGINFASDNVTWIIQSNITLSNSLNITGSNSNIQLKSNVTIPSGMSMNANNITISSGNLTILNGGTLNASGDFVTQTGTSVSNAGTMNIVGNLSQESYGVNASFTNTGIINLDGNYTLTGNNIFDNQGTFNITTGSFVVNNSPANFTNNLNGKVLINNTNSSTSTIGFPNSVNLTLKATSSFNIIGSDVLLTATSPLQVDGLLTVQNGNMSFQGGSSGITVSNTGALYLFDTNGDPYSSKGIFDEGTGNETITINGVFYVEGVTATGGTNSVNVGSTGLISIGNIGLVNTVGNNNAFKVNGGTINFCGNLSVNDDKLGTITNGSTLNYTSSDYVAGVNPGAASTGGQGDFATDPGVVQIPAYSTKQACMDQFIADVAAAVPYSVTSLSNVLPISLEYFDVKLNGERVALEWRTATETNNDFFTVLKSYDASTFEILGTVNGAGTSTIKHNYKFYDEDPQNGLNYYKVKQTDFDGMSTFTQTKSVKFKKKNVYMQVYPIPGHIQDITIKLWSEKSETVNVMISDLLGRVYSSGQVEVSNDRLEIPLTSFAEFIPGKYIVSVVSKMFVENIEIIVE